MKQRLIIAVLAGVLSLGYGSVAAQEHPGGGMQGRGAGQQHMMSPGMMHNMGMMSDMMRDMQQIMGSQRMTPEQYQQMMQMMNRMGQMMQEMQGPQAAQMEPQHTRQLKEMEQQLKGLKEQMQKQKQQEHKH